MTAPDGDRLGELLTTYTARVLGGHVAEAHQLGLAIRHLFAAQAAAAPAVVWAVCCSNYEPAEVDSLWADEQAARARAAVLEGRGSLSWSVRSWEVQAG